MDNEPIHVIVEGEDGDEAAGSSAQRIAALNRQAAADRAFAARTRRETAQLQRDSVLRKIDADRLTVESETKAAEAAYRNAREFGDVDAEVSATKRLSAAESRNNMLQTQRAAVERAPISSGDPFEDHLAQHTPRTAEWMREHKDWVTDPRRNSKLIGAHHMAIAEGLDPDSDAYFDHCERTLGLRGGGSRGGNMRSGSSDINPSDVNTHVQNGGKSVYLTENEKKIATDGTLVWNYGPNKGKPLGTAEFAKRKAAQIAAGLHNKLG
jgi:hypothetical protein